jgi:GNAT superfamily N-acetyltransferase
VIVATPAHAPSWLGLVREVEPLFGPMPDFEETLRRNINRGSAFCTLLNERVVGGMLVGGPTPADRWIRWLAVTGVDRRRGVGGALVEKALKLFPPPCTVSLHTFGEDNPDGAAARRLYLRYGFEPRAMADPGPEGGSRQLFVLGRA